MSERASVRQRLKDGWMAIIGRFGASQTLVILGLVYTFVFGPVSLVLGLLRQDPLHKRWQRADSSAWSEADSAEPDLERAKLTS